jgi:hypothetical protein
MIDTILWAAVLASFMFTFYVLAQFSEKLGEALQLRSYYVLYYVAILLLFVSIQLDLLGVASGNIASVSACTSGLPEKLTAIGMTIGTVTTIKYWGWLFRAQK